MSFFDELGEEPWRFDLLNVLRRLERETPNKPRIGDSATLDEEIVFLGQDPYVEFPASNVAGFGRDSKGRPLLTCRFLGMLGPQGALPLQTTIEAKDFKDHGDEAFARFLDIFNRRFLQLFFRVWSDSRPVGQRDRPDDDRFARYVGSAVGIGTSAFEGRDHVPDLAKFSLAGLLGPAIKSAVRIEGMFAHTFGVKVLVDQLVGTWLKLETSDQSSLGGINAGLGKDTMIGTAVYSVQDKIRIKIETRSLAEFESFLPGGRHFDTVVDLMYFYLGDLLEYEMQLLIPTPMTKPVALSSFGRLGWTTWMPESRTPADTELKGDCAFHPAERAARDRLAASNSLSDGKQRWQTSASKP